MAQLIGFTALFQIRENIGDIFTDLEMCRGNKKQASCDSSS
jgi:hypothetical protein